MTLASSSAPGTSLGSSGSVGKFLFCTGRIVTSLLPNLVPPRRIDDYVVIHFLHQNCTLWARLYQHVFCKEALLFSTSSRYRSLGLSGSDCKYCVYPNRVPLLLATTVVIHEKNWKCHDPLAQGFSVAPKDYFHRPNFL